MVRKINQWPEEDRPREKLKMKGVSALSNTELLAILLNNGTRNRTALELARDILELGGGRLQGLATRSLEELTRVPGIGPAKAITVLAAMELGRRKHSEIPETREAFTRSSEVAGFLSSMLADKPHEVFGVLFLNQANKLRHFEIISQGGITATVVDPRIILRKALENNAVSIILFHNHPSGNLTPSEADRQVTHKIREAGKYHDIRVLDHIIVAETGYYSFADNGEI